MADAPTPAPYGDHARSLHLRAYSMESLEAEPSLARPLRHPIAVTRGPATTTFSGGWVVPVFSGHFAGEWEAKGRELLSRRFDAGEDVPVPGPEERGDRELVGYVWLAGTDGKASFASALADRADALRLANRMVGALGEPKERWASVAHGEEPLRAAVTEAVVLSVDPAVDLAALGPEGVDDPFEVVVWADRAEARRMGEQGARVLKDRAAAWVAAGADRTSDLAWDRIRVEAGGDPTAGWWVVDVLTDLRFGYVVDPRTPAVDPRADRWLTLTAHPSGADERRSVRLAAVGLSPGGEGVNAVIGGVPLSDPLEPPTPAIRWDAGTAKGRALVQPSASGGAATVQVSLDLTVTCRGGPQQVLDLVIPKVDEVPGTWVITAVRLADGTSLLGRGVSLVAADGTDRKRKDDEDDDELPEEEEEEASPVQRLVLPTPVPADGQVTIHVEYHDTWPFAAYATLNSIGGPQTVGVGGSTGLRPVIPRLSPARVGNPWQHDLTIGVPAGGKLVPAISGATTRTWEDRGWSLTQARCETERCRWPDVAVGRFVVRDDPAAKGFPAIKVRLLSSHYGAITQMAPEARRVIQYYQGWLPPFPVQELEVFEGPSSLNGFTWIAPHGLVALQTAKTAGSVQAESYWNPRWDAPHLESGVYAHEIAHQYFGHMAVPATTEDFWIAESFAELYASMYVGAAFDPKDYEVRMREARRRWEQDDVRGSLGPGSLTFAYDSTRQPDVVYRYGPFVFGEMLRGRIGVEAFFAALDGGLRERPGGSVTSERVQGWFESTAGRSLDAFFDYWVHGGFVPDVAAVWSVADGVVTVDVTSNVPFGTFDIPVVVEVAGVASPPVWVTVVDGAGHVEVPAGDGKITVELDPDHHTLTRKRSVAVAR